MEKKFIYKFAEEFTDTPGPRYRKLGDKSGEEFREDVLRKLLKEYEIIEIDGSGIKTSFNPSFLSEAFSPLYKELGRNNFFKKIKLFSKNNQKLEEKFKMFAKPIDEK